MPACEEAAPISVPAAFKKLLTEKHLYQYVQVDTDFVEKIAAALQEDYMQGMGPTTSHVPELEEIQAEGMKVLDRQWLPVDSTQVLESHDSDSEIHFVLPTIHTFCQDCDKVWPF